MLYKTPESHSETLDFIVTAPAELTTEEDTLVNKWIEEITIYKDKTTIRFKSDLQMDVGE